MADFFDINFNQLVEERIPPRMRRPRVLAFAKALSMEVSRQHNQFRVNRKSNLYRLAITPQVCYLERMLNDRYDYTNRRIYIGDGNDQPPTYIYQSAEQKPLYLGSQTIYTGGESGELKDDFIVNVPAVIVFEDAEMVALINVYKLAGTKFKIQRF